MIKIDKTVMLSIAGTALALTGNIIKVVADKKVNDAKLAKLVEEVVENKINQ